MVKPQVWFSALLMLGGVWYFAFQRQAGYAWQRRSQLGVSGGGVGGANRSFYAQEILQDVKDIMDNYRRKVAG